MIDQNKLAVALDKENTDEDTALRVACVFARQLALQISTNSSSREKIDVRSIKSELETIWASINNLRSIRIANFFRYLRINKIELKKNKYDICLISENAYDLNSKLGEDGEEEGFANMVKFVIRYAKETNIKFIFARKRKNFTSLASDEMSFFKKYLSETELNYLKNNMNEKINEHSSYFPLFQSKIAIGTQSTLLKDKLSCREKILSLNLQKTNIYDFPISGVCSLKNCSYEEFKERVNMIFSMSDKEYFLNISKNFNNLIEFSKDENVIDKIKNSINENL